MRWFGIIVTAGVAITAGYELGRLESRTHPPAAPQSGILYYVDPMHPSYRSNSPGIAPDCGMRLVPVMAEGKGAVSHPDLTGGGVQIDENTRKLLGITFASVENNASTQKIRAVGRVVPEDGRVYKLNSGVDGFIRQTYRDSVGTFVKKDQKLADYYAPEFLSAASGFLAANERVPGTVVKEGARSIQNYTDRLRNLGMSDTQIKRVAETRQLPETVDVVSPTDGLILTRAVSPGQHVERNTEFYRIADLSEVWVEAEVLEEDVLHLPRGRMGTVSCGGENRKWSARIAESLPQSDRGGGTVKLRLQAANPGLVLRPDLLVDVEFLVQIPPTVTVPVDAVVNAGSGPLVYVEQPGGTLEPRGIETGWRYGGQVQVVRGLRAGDRVVTGSTFLIDSESRLTTPATALAQSGRRQGAGASPPAGGATDPNCGMPVDRARADALGNVLEYHGVVYRFCSRQCKQAFAANPAAVLGKHRNADD